MVKELKNIVFLAFISILCIIYYFDVQKLPQPEERNLVNFLFWAIAILIVLELIKSIYQGIKNKSESETSLFQDIKIWLKDKQFILLVSIIGYIILIPLLGFFVSSFIFLFILNYILESRKKWELIVLPLALLIFIYILFVVLLNINLPKGILF